ncbi:phosphoglucomutase/phosphomannomutase family protein [Brevibacillus massiliensis]|jgi:alpha-D-glucose phosphate-specific phosphoglucomutase|uniref:phosphoglucomutase/phosphomannomutase family protein n=1 Tax=Brevibacillus massiliensis TaxID=1118054 RepID=UPI0002D8B70D|nr:phosphoglucomutase/phosphomannomutase family protein [Brevibacillus massiliensis]
MSRRITFGTDGWRAVFADGFTVENVRIAAQAIAALTVEKGQQEQGIIVGYDTRFMGRSFAEEVVRTLTANEIKTYIVNEATPTPVVAFGVKNFAASGAVVVTASHNPPEYNGIKYIPDYAGPANPEITERIEALIREIQETGQVKLISKEEAIARRLMRHIYLRPHYEAHLRRMIHFDVIKQAGLRVVVDPMHGAGIGYVSRMLAEAGAEVTAIRSNADPLFGGDLPEPTERRLKGLAEEVVRQRADLGLATDGDADRFGVVDHTGKYVSANQILSLLTRHLVKNRGQVGRVVRTVATTHLIDRIAGKYGLGVTETPVGFKYIGAEMLQGDVLIGAEESGGGSVSGHIPEKDGILLNLLVAEMCAWERKSLEQMLSDLHDEVGRLYSTRLDVRLDGQAARMKSFLQTPPRQVGPYRVKEAVECDGVKLLLEQGHWMLIRPSGTEPLLRIYCEAANREAFADLCEAVEDWRAGY